MAGKVDILTSLTAGDEGKSRALIALTSRKKYKGVVRFQGGNNAGHTIQVGEEVYKLHLTPAGLVKKDTYGIIGNGTVVDPGILIQEVNELKERGLQMENLRISDCCHIIFPYHRALDCIQEARRAPEEKLGTTKRGIGPVMQDKVSRGGIRLQDLLDKDVLKNKLEKILVKNGRQEEIREALDSGLVPEEERVFLEKSLDIDTLAKEYFQYGEDLGPHITNTNHFIWDLLEEGYDLFCEGAQGPTLDIDYGAYPFVTSSNVVSGAVATGAAIPPKHVRDVFGVMKSFITRVDTVGTFPTYDTSDVAEDIIDRGKEFGTTTGRRRRFGWLDLVLCKNSTLLNGTTKLVLNKIDVFSGVKEIKLAVAYEFPDGTVTDKYPSNTQELRGAKPVYKIFSGWEEDISGVKNFEDLPVEAQEFVNFIEDFLGQPIVCIGVGPEDSQTIFKD